MRNHFRLLVSVLGAASLVGAVLTDALASPVHAPQRSAPAAAKHHTIDGTLDVAGVLRVHRNTSVSGRMYAHGGEQIWRGLIVHSGGIKTDALDVTGPLQVQQNASIAGSLTSDALTATSLLVNGAADINGALTAKGRISGNGLDAGSAGLTTTGNVSAAGVSASSLTDTGALTAGAGTFTGLTVTGNVNFSGASVTGLNVSNLNLSGANLSSLSIGNASGTTPPLAILENGHTAQLGVDANGVLSVDNLAASNLTASKLQGPSSGSNGAGPLTIQGGALTLAGSSIGLNADTTLQNGSDLVLSAGGTGSSMSHIRAAGDTDVAGQVTISVPSGTSAGHEAPSKSITFVASYNTPPVVTLTAAGDPAPESASPPKVWVTLQTGASGQYTGFTVHYAPSADVANSHNVTYNYLVVGS